MPCDWLWRDRYEEGRLLERGTDLLRLSGGNRVASLRIIVTPASQGRSIRGVRGRGWLRVATFGVLTVLVFGILLNGLMSHGFSGDLLMDIANGRFILAHGYVPLKNVLTQARYGAQWANDEWLFGVYTAWLYANAGIQGVLWGLIPVLILIASAIAFLANRVPVLVAAPLTAVTAFAVGMGMSPRPQLFSYLFFAIALISLLEYRLGRRWLLWAAALVTLVWTNLHGSALLFPLLVLSEVLLVRHTRAQRKELGLAAVAGVLLSVAHPGGATMGAGFLGEILSPGIVNHIVEWLPLAPISVDGWPMAVLFVFAGWLAWRAIRRDDSVSLAWLAVGIAVSAFAMRFMPYAALGILAVAATEPSLGSALQSSPGRLKAWLAAVLLVGSVALGVGEGVSSPPFIITEPMPAISWLKAHHARHVLDFYAFGDALDLYGIQAWVDGRAELWTNQPWWEPYLRTQFGQASPALFAARYDPSARYIMWFGFPATVREMRRSPAWHLAYKDKQSASRIPDSQGVGVVDIWARTPNK